MPPPPFWANIIESLNVNGNNTGNEGDLEISQNTSSTSSPTSAASVTTTAATITPTTTISNTTSVPSTTIPQSIETDNECLPKYRRDLVAKQKILRAELNVLQPQSGHCRFEVSRSEIFEVRKYLFAFGYS